MPSPGDTVCFYTHEASDTLQQTIDLVAIVLRVTDDYVDLKVFEWGEAPYDERAYAYSGPEYDAAGNLVVGKSYWRELGSDAPDFDAPARDEEAEPREQPTATPDESHDAALARLQERQAKELEAGGDKDALAAKHDRELEEFEQGWDDSYKAPGQPVKGLTLKTSVSPPPTIGKSLPKIL